MSVEYGIITSVVPPGGWHYKQLLSNGESIRVTGDGFEQLLSNLEVFRRRHSDLCGGVAQAENDVIRADIRDYYCRNFKQNCAGSVSVPMVQSGGIGVTNYVSPVNKAADWLVGIGSGRFEHVNAAQAAQRAQICAQCPQNVRWETPCAPCNDNIRIRSQNAKGSLATPYDRLLQVCRTFGHLNEVAVWLADPGGKSEQQPPSHCWLITEKQNG